MWPVKVHEVGAVNLNQQRVDSNLTYQTSFLLATVPQRNMIYNWIIIYQFLIRVNLYHLINSVNFFIYLSKKI